MSWYLSKTLFWLRFGHRIVVLTNAPMLFSERYGYSKYWPLWFGWRLSVQGSSK